MFGFYHKQALLSVKWVVAVLFLSPLSREGWREQIFATSRRSKIFVATQQDFRRDENFQTCR